MTLRRLRTPMYRKRMKSYPPIPYNMHDLTRALLRSPRLSKTVDEAQNLYAGSVTALDGSHHILFFSPRMLEWMKRVKILHADGTFKARPAFPHSFQCLVLVATWRNCVIPLGWVLMEKRSYLAYKAVFNLIKQLCPDLNPDVIVSDWEYPQQRAWSEAFPNAEIHGCLWHLCRAFVRKANSLKIMKFRKAVPNILKFIRRACAIALLPENLLEDALNIFRNEAQEEDQMAAYLVWPFFTYVQEKWLEQGYRRQWLSFFKALHRTNNACETHIKMLRCAVGAYRPNIWHFLEAIARLEHNAFLDIDLLNDGGQPKRTRSWKSIYSDRQLQALCEDLEMDIFNDRDVSIKNFIARASHLFHGAFDNHVRAAVGEDEE